MPLLAEAPPPIQAVDVEALAEPVLEALAQTGTDPQALQRFAEAWDASEVGPADLYPGRGRIGAVSVMALTGLSQEALAFLACGCLRPPLERYFAGCQAYLGGTSDRHWDGGVCPCCGAPPGFTEFHEDGQRRLVCHLCGVTWTFSRLRCPYCGSQNPADFVRLLAEDAEEGYAIFACKPCQGYLKELDRRLRWNVASALVEDWGSPHLDLIAQRAGYWRAVPTLIQPARPA